MINENIKACLFDLDGVIVFTDKYHYLAWKKIADENGWDFDEKVNNRLRGVPRLESLNEILKHNNTDIPMAEKEELMAKKNAYYVELLSQLNEGDLYPGAIEFIKKLRKKGIKIALCSSSKNAPFVLQRFGIEDLFDTVVTGFDIKHAKPDPEIFMLAAQRLRIPAFHCVVFEDSLVGIQGALACGMKTVGVGNREETEELAFEFIKDYNEINIATFIESGRKQPFTPDPWEVTEVEVKKNDLTHMESMYALVNGYMGLRGTFDGNDRVLDSASVPGMYINGIYESHPFNHVVAYKGFSKNEQYTVNLCDWRIINTYIDDELVSFSDGKMLSHKRTLDMKNGVLKREFTWESESGKQIAVKSVRMVNMERIHGAEVSYTVTPVNFDGEIKLESNVIKTMPIQGKDATENVETGKVDGISYFVTATKNTKLSIAMALKDSLVTSCGYVRREIGSENVYSDIYTVDAKKGEGVTLQKFVSFYTSEDGVDCIIGAAVDDLKENVKLGFDALLKEQSDFWARHWEKGDVVISGNVADQQAVRYNLYQLRQQLPKEGALSIGATGLTGPNYSGKVFWDTEMYIAPYLNYTDPASTKPLLMYRYAILPKARERAQIMDGKGAMYSWCSISGEETSVVYEASTAEYHLQSDVAYGIWRYYMSTGDDEFMLDYGDEMLFETARYMLSRGEFIEALGNRFCIHVVCGPDEYACASDNNFYTNFMAKFHFEFAVRMYNKMKGNPKHEALCEKIGLTEDEVKLFAKAAEQMYFRYNEKLKIYEQDDRFVTKNTVDMDLIPKNFDIRDWFHPLNLWRIQVLKQADVVMLMFARGELFTLEDKKNNYEYYEPKTNHGSSLSAAVHAIIANEIGKYDDAYAYFRSAAYMDMSDFKHNTAGGLHLACLGGVWMSVVNGFLGMRDYDKKGLILNPHLPASWTACEIKLNYRGRIIGIKAEQNKTTYTLLEGDELTFTAGEEMVTLTKDAPIVC